MMQTPETLASTPQSRPRSGRSSRIDPGEEQDDQRAGRIEQADVRGRSQPRGVEEESLVDRDAHRGGDEQERPVAAEDPRQDRRSATTGRRNSPATPNRTTGTQTGGSSRTMYRAAAAVVEPKITISPT